MVLTIYAPYKNCHFIFFNVCIITCHQRPRFPQLPDWYLFLDQHLSQTNLNQYLYTEQTRDFKINGTLLQRFKFSTQIFDLNFQLSLPGMFGNGTLVDLLRFDKVVQARTKVPSKGPVRRAGDWNRRSGTSLGSIGAAQAHLRAHAH